MPGLKIPILQSQKPTITVLQIHKKDRSCPSPPHWHLVWQKFHGFFQEKRRLQQRRNKNSKAPANLYRSGRYPLHTRVISQDYLDTPDSPATPTDSITQYSKSNKSSRASSVKNLSCLLMTKNPVDRSENISEIPAMGQDLYKELFMCEHAQGISPSAPKVCVVV